MPSNFAGLNFKKLATALDLNNNSIIEEQEFIDLMQKSLSSGLETEQYQKITNAISGSPVKQKTMHQKSENSTSVEMKVHPKHRVTHAECISYYK